MSETRSAYPASASSSPLTLTLSVRSSWAKVSCNRAASAQARRSTSSSRSAMRSYSSATRIRPSVVTSGCALDDQRSSASTPTALPPPSVRLTIGW
ncbi:Uncharacterised protein [Mycobacteroides abscessus subsp. abscessus]|nr:Uncharacterised protein [Mycobacteroides abscessus subsp. abscessus]